MDKWINGLAKDKIDIVLFPVKEKESIIISPLQLKALIENELEQYSIQEFDYDVVISRGFEK